MAKKKVDEESTKEVEYVASGLDISYSVPIGLTAMLAAATKENNKEIWCKLSDIANVCASRLVTRLKPTGSRWGNSKSSWTTQKFPGSDIRLRLDMDGYIESTRYDFVTKQHIELEHPKMKFTCRVKVAGTRTETFTQAQINDYITDKILLGDDEDFCGTLDAADESVE